MTSGSLATEFAAFCVPGADKQALAKQHPIPYFDDHVDFYDWIWVDEHRRALPNKQLPAESECRHGLVDDSDNTTLLGHKYFVDGRLMDGSATGFVKSFFDEFDEKAQVQRIARSDRAWRNPLYKYYQKERDTLTDLWPELVEAASRVDVELCSDCAQYYDGDSYSERRDQWTLDRSFFANLEEEIDTMQFDVLSAPSLDDVVLFHRVRIWLAEQIILQEWAETRNEAARLGTEMHETIELFYNGCFDPTADRFLTTEMSYFYDFHREWVKPRRLEPFRTELCLYHLGVELCGMIDMLYRRADHAADPLLSKNLVMVDWKRSKEIKLSAFSADDRGQPPLDALPNCNHSHYTVQLNTYKTIIELLTNYRITSMHLAVFHPNQETYDVYDVQDLGDRIDICMQQRGAAKIEAYMDERKLSLEALELSLRNNDTGMVVEMAESLVRCDRALDPLLIHQLQQSKRQAQTSNNQIMRLYDTAAKQKKRARYE